MHDSESHATFCTSVIYFRAIPKAMQFDNTPESPKLIPKEV